MAQPSIQSFFDPIVPVNKKKRDREEAQEEIFDEEEDDDEEMEEEDNEVFVSAKRLDDGQFEITTNKRTIMIDKRTADYVESKNKLRNLKLDAQGYICSGYTPLHQIVADEFCKKDDEVKAQYPEHFKANPHDTIAVMHLDDNKLNFNIDNLERGPQMLNKYMQMCQPRPNGNKFQGFVSVGKKLEATKTVATVEEAKHATDILKIQKMPREFRTLIFNYAMHKPAEYAEHYASVETLLARAPIYAKAPREPQKPRVSKNIYEVFRTEEEAYKNLDPEHTRIVKGILDTPGVVPFDVALDAVIRYTGSSGKKVQHVFLFEYACYKEHLEQNRPMIATSGKYLSIKLADGMNFLHNVVLGRPIGQKGRDGLEGGHGWGKTLDNRKRTLAAQTKSVNMSERGGSDDKSVPGVVGVTMRTNGTFVAQIGSFFERVDNVYLGSYKTAEEASGVYQFALANKAQLVEACKDPKNRNAEVRARCVAKRV